MMKTSELKFDQNGLIPVIIQDVESKEVLMLAYMNKETIDETLRIRKTVFWSRSRQRRWLKGETSKNFQYVKRVLYDCDLDTLLIQVEQKGVACHTGERSCFYRVMAEFIG
jgi:phosphoribosyl-AMP cyclohydrolase